jgi:hypothetical protein
LSSEQFGKSYRVLATNQRWKDYTNDQLHEDLDSYVSPEFGNSLVERLEKWGRDKILHGKDVFARQGGVRVLVGKDYSLEVADFKKISNRNLSSDQRVHVVEHSKIMAVENFESRYDSLTKDEKERLSAVKRSLARQGWVR